MDDQQKLDFLKYLDTKSLIEKLAQYEKELQKVLREQTDFVAKEHDYTTSRGTDCHAVKSIIAELNAQIPDTNGGGKKLTVADRETFLVKQRKENKELSEAIQRQHQVSFLQDDWQINVEMTKKRLESIKAVLALKTAQLNFLAS